MSKNDINALVKEIERKKAEQQKRQKNTNNIYTYTFYGILATASRIDKVKITITNNDTYNAAVYHGLACVCDCFNISVPVWYDDNITEFKKYGKTIFTQNNYVFENDVKTLEFSMV